MIEHAACQYCSFCRRFTIGCSPVFLRSSIDPCYEGRHEPGNYLPGRVDHTVKTGRTRFALTVSDSLDIIATCEMDLCLSEILPAVRRIRGVVEPESV